MAIFLGNNAGLKIATVDLSDHVQSITINRVAEQLDITAQGDTARKFGVGLEASSISVTFYNDAATASVLQTLQDAWGTTVAVSMIQVKGTAVSAANKSYSTTILVDNLTDINNQQGEYSTLDITFTCQAKVVPSTSVAF